MVVLGFSLRLPQFVLSAGVGQAWYHKGGTAAQTLARGEQTLP